MSSAVAVTSLLASPHSISISTSSSSSSFHSRNVVPGETGGEISRFRPMCVVGVAAARVASRRTTLGPREHLADLPTGGRGGADGHSRDRPLANSRRSSRSQSRRHRQRPVGQRGDAATIARSRSRIDHRRSTSRCVSLVSPPFDVLLLPLQTSSSRVRRCSSSST